MPCLTSWMPGICLFPLCCHRSHGWMPLPVYPRGNQRRDNFQYVLRHRCSTGHRSPMMHADMPARRSRSPIFSMDLTIQDQGRLGIKLCSPLPTGKGDTAGDAQCSSATVPARAADCGPRRMHTVFAPEDAVPSPSLLSLGTVEPNPARCCLPAWDATYPCATAAAAFSGKRITRAGQKVCAVRNAYSGSQLTGNKDNRLMHIHRCCFASSLVPTRSL